MELHLAADQDNGPMQMISAKLLAYLQACAVELEAIKAKDEKKPAD